MLYMLEQFELAVCALAENGSAEGLHDLLDRHRRVCELIFRRTVSWTTGQHLTGLK